MKRILPLLLLSLCCSCARAESPKPLLWKVSDQDNSVYLLGSFHLLKPDDYPLAASTDAAFADAEKLVFEVPPAELSDPALGQKMAKAAMRADGRTLQASLPPDTWAKLDAYAKSHNVPLANLQSFEPWFVSLMISIMEMQRLGLDAELGLDKHFAAMAAKAGKPTAGLETGDMQIALFDGMTDAEQTQLILDTLDELDGSGKRIDEMHAMWRRGEGDRLFAETGAEMKAKYPSLYARMNSDRNRAWLPQVQKMLDDGNSDDTLVVVGSMHLLGSDGLVALLKAKGYTVEKL
jgi:uncharacterized protein